MGLLSRGKDEPPHRLPGYAALAREDVEDARRRRPDVDLSGYAAERGLDFLGSRNPAGYFAAVPLDERLQFNVVRGLLDGRRDGCLFHWVRAWPTGTDGRPGPGTFYGRYWNTGLKGWWKPAPLSLIPYVGGLFDLLTTSHPSGTELAIGIPFTVAATNVPEAAMLDLSIDNRAKPFSVGGHRVRLKDRGLPGFDLIAPREPPAALVERLLTGPLYELIAGAGARFAQFDVAVRNGTVMVRRNGYAKEPADLDALARAACIAGDAIRDAYAPELAPQPFDARLPLVDWPPSGISMSGRFPPSPWLEALHGLAAELGLALEQPAAYHRAYAASVPVPGRPFAVLRGRLPGTATVGRLLFTDERTLSHNDGRTALLLPAAPGAAETPPWGVRNEQPRIAYAVRDGIFSAWVLRSSGRLGDLGDVPGLLTTALRFGVERGLVDVREAPEPA
jgi:hypothetical protein